MKTNIKFNLLSLTIVSLLAGLPQAYASEVAGKTIIAKGNVIATETAGSLQRDLKRRSPVFDVDVVTTAANSNAQMRMLDGGMIALKENSELIISKYQYDPATSSGSVAMELLKGGLRSVSGAIKAEKGNYQLTTPVGSIGIRGTHYEIEIIAGEVFIAVWDGAVDITVDVGSGEQTGVSLGEGEDFSYAFIDSTGEVTELLAPPENFNSGHSADPQEEGGQENNEQTPQETAAVTEAGNQETDTATTETESETTQETVAQTPAEEPPPELAPEEQEMFIPPPDLGELVRARTGSVVYNQVSDISVTSTLGAVSNFQASMTVDFDNATVPTGNLSFNDSGGEWFAAFNGIINVDKFEIDVNFASHGNNRADGNIDAAFVQDLDTVFTSFELFERNNNGVRAEGNYLIK